MEQRLGKYQLIRRLATGGMAEVFLAKAAGPMGFQKTLVVKRILPHLAEDPEFVAMFLSEAKIAAELNHPNIVQIFDFGQEDGTYFIAMEYIDGPNLRALGKRAQNAGLDLPFHLVAKIVSLVCEGLAFAHDHASPETGQPLNLIHRDISPDNIILSRAGTVKVLDFGVAKVATNRGLTRSGMVKGKMSYMAPEQLADEPLDRRADVFALGIVFFELLAGRLPFDDRSDALIVQALMSNEPFPAITQFRPETPPALVRVLQRALEKDVSARYASAKALQSDVERFILSLAEPVQTYDLARLVERLEDPSQVTEPRGRALAGVGNTVTAPELGRLEGFEPGALPDPRTRTPRPDRDRPARPAERGRTPAPPPRMEAEPEPLTAENLPVEHDEDDADPMAETWVQVGPLPHSSEVTQLAAPPLPTEPSGHPELDPASELDPISDRTEPLHVLERRLLESRPVPPGEAVTRELTSPLIANRQEGYADRFEALVARRRRAMVWGAIAALVVLIGVLALVVMGALASEPSVPTPPPGNPPLISADVKPLEPPVTAPEAPPPEPAPPLVASAEGKPAGDDVKPAAEVSTPGEPQVAPEQTPLASEPVRKASGTKPKGHHAATAQADKRRDPAEEAFVERGTIEFRIRPYAQIFLDGKNLGQTPFGPVPASAGKHTVRMVNAKLGRDTTVEFTVKPNEENIFRFNLRED